MACAGDIYVSRRSAAGLSIIAQLSGLATGAADSVVKEPDWARVPIRSAELAQLELGAWRGLSGSAHAGCIAC